MMKRTAKKFISLLLTLAMMASLCVGLSVMAMAAVTFDDNYELVMSFDKPTISVSDQSQIVRLSLTTKEPIEVATTKAVLSGLPEGWKLVEIVNDDPRITIPAGQINLAKLTHSWVAADAENILTDQMATYVIEIPANEKAGEYELTFSGITLGKDYGYVAYIQNGTAAATLTIEEPKEVSAPEYTVTVDGVNNSDYYETERVRGDILTVTMTASVAGVPDGELVGINVYIDARFLEWNDLDDDLTTDGVWAEYDGDGTVTILYEAGTTDSDTITATMYFKAIQEGEGPLECFSFLGEQFSGAWVIVKEPEEYTVTVNGKTDGNTEVQTGDIVTVDISAYIADVPRGTPVSIELCIDGRYLEWLEEDSVSDDFLARYSGTNILITGVADRDIGNTMTGTIYLKAIKEGSSTIYSYVRTGSESEKYHNCVTVIAKDLDEIEDPDTPLAPVPDSYTITVADQTAGVAAVKIGDEVTMNVTVSDNDFATVEGTVTYDAALFELKNVVVNGDQQDSDTSASGEVYFRSTTEDNRADGTVVATLTFTAKASGTGVFGIKDGAAITSEAQAGPNDMIPATGAGDSVKVLAEYTVTFNNDGATTDYAVTEGAKLAEVPADPTAPEGKTFEGWKNNDTVYSAEDIKDMVITSDMTFTAEFSDIELTVTVKDQDNEAVEKPVLYGKDVVIQISNYDPVHCEYAVTVNGTAVDVTVDDEGSFTIANVKADTEVVITATQKIMVSVNEYVAGVTLVTVTGPDDNYSYDGHVMYHSTDKDGNDIFLWLVNGNVTQADAAKLAAASDEARVELNKSTDVNASGKTDLADWGAAYSCYKVVYDVEKYMALYLRADVNGDSVVNLADVVSVLSAVTR